MPKRAGWMAGDPQDLAESSEGSCWIGGMVRFRSEAAMSRYEMWTSTLR